MKRKQEYTDISDAFDKFLSNFKGDESAIKSSIEKGIPYYTSDDKIPENCLYKHFPDGHIELVIFNESGDTLVKKL